MEELILRAKLRNGKGKSYTRKLRKRRNTPAVLYGHHLKKNLLLEIENRELYAFLSRYLKGGKVIKLQIANKKENRESMSKEVIIKSIQEDPLKRTPQHIDFYEITWGEKVTATVPLSFLGRSRGEEKGGIVEHLLRELVIECFPEKIPSTIEVDITSLDIGDSLQVKDLRVPSGITIKNPPQEIVLSIISPRGKEKLEELEEEKVEEVEVITEKKEKVEKEIGEKENIKGKE